MIEFAVLAAIALAVALYIAIPRSGDLAAGEEDAALELRELHAGLLAELRELDDDLAAGRISAEERAEGRRALSRRLRLVTEALRERGEAIDAPAT